MSRWPRDSDKCDGVLAGRFVWNPPSRTEPFYAHPPALNKGDFWPTIPGHRQGRTPFYARGISSGSGYEVEWISTASQVSPVLVSKMENFIEDNR